MIWHTGDCEVTVGGIGPDCDSIIRPYSMYGGHLIVDGQLPCARFNQQVDG